MVTAAIEVRAVSTTANAKETRKQQSHQDAVDDTDQSKVGSVVQDLEPHHQPTDDDNQTSDRERTTSLPPRTRAPPPMTYRRATTAPETPTSMLEAPGANAGKADMTENQVSPSEIPMLVRSMSCPDRVEAMLAIEHRARRFRLSTSVSVRESVRQMYSYMLRDFPAQCYQRARAQVQMGPVWRHMEVTLDRDGLMCARTSLVRKKRKQIEVGADEILGAHRIGNSKEIVIHYMKPGRGTEEKALRRRYRQLHVLLQEESEVEAWVTAVYTLVKWHARVPLDRTRKIKVVVNPHSGKGRAVRVWDAWRPVLELAGIQCDVELTQYAGHARDIGTTFDLNAKYEAIVFVGGDGTVNEFINGVFRRPEAEWRQLVATTPVSLLCAGTDNAFGKGVGIPTHAAAVYCIIKRKIRPLDVLTCEGENADGSKHREFSCCGVSYGIGADIAMESEQTRWLGVHRYKWLKVKRAVLAPRPHECTIKYALSDTVDTDPDTGHQLLQTYYECFNRKASDQHNIEMCSVYDDVHSEKRWSGDADSIFHPASEERFSGKWVEEHHDYNTVGAANVYFESVYYHPSDGNMDLVIARRGNVVQSADTAMKYVFGNALNTPLVDYFKIKALVIDQIVDDPLNVDGEVFPGPGPFRVEVVPHLLSVLSEM